MSTGKPHTIGHRTFRQRPLRRDAKLKQKHLDAAWKLYQQGYSVPWIAERMWVRFGYATQKSCQDALYRLFQLDLKLARPLSEARLLDSLSKSCAACGVPREERTRGCTICTCRHLKRQSLGYSHVSAGCGGCGSSYDERTPGCSACTARHKWRRQRARLAAAA